MEAKELMIGDWVIFGDEPLKVQHIYNNGYDDVVAEIVEEGTNEYGVYEEIKDVPVVYCSPVPLTPEILEKNGWWFDRVDAWWHNKAGFIIDKWNGRFQCHEIPNMKLNYVHQIQQALRLCRHNELADNFKV